MGDAFRSDISLLKSKLKRLKIKHQVLGNKIIIGKAKFNYLVLFGLVIFPFLSSLGFAYLVLFQDIRVFSQEPVKMTLVILGLFATAIFYAVRLLSNKYVNNSIKTLYNNSLKIHHKNFIGSFDKNNTMAIVSAINEIHEDVYEGTLYLIDDQENVYPLFGFDDEQKSFVENDLKWFAEYFSNQLGLEDSEQRQQ